MGGSYSRISLSVSLSVCLSVAVAVAMAQMTFVQLAIGEFCSFYLISQSQSIASKWQMIWLVIWLVRILTNQIADHTHDDCKSNSNQKRSVIGHFFNHPIKSWTTMLSLYLSFSFPPSPSLTSLFPSLSFSPSLSSLSSSLSTSSLSSLPLLCHSYSPSVTRGITPPLTD